MLREMSLTGVFVYLRLTLFRGGRPGKDRQRVLLLALKTSAKSPWAMNSNTIQGLAPEDSPEADFYHQTEQMNMTAMRKLNLPSFLINLENLLRFSTLFS